MDLAQTLIRSTVRAFYETKYVLIVDALMIHSALPVEDLAHVIGWQTKDARKFCGKLREDRLIATHSRQEFKEGQQRSSGRDYYYINFHETIDAIKYKVFHLTRRIQDLYKSTEERKDFKCPRCKAAWTEFEVLDNFGPEGFLCHRCNSLLDRDDSAGKSGGHEKQSRLMGQLDRMLKLLQQIDAQDIPKHEFQDAIAVAKPVEKNQAINPSKPTTLGDEGRGPPVTVKGVAQAAAPLEISLTTNSEKTAEEQAADAERKAVIAAQNVVPDWMARSTVNGETTAVGIAERDRKINNASLETAKVEEDEKKDKTVLADELAAYYAQMAAEQVAEQEKQAAADRDGSSGDEEDEFEDVDVETTGTNTPSSSTPVTLNGLKNEPLNELVKSQISDSGSSNPGTGTSTPAGLKRSTVDGEDHPVKKVKLEGQDNGVVEDKGTPGDKVSDEDDEAEFEDV